jgi:hypothetical protein
MRRVVGLTLVLALAGGLLAVTTVTAFADGHGPLYWF